MTVEHFSVHSSDSVAFFIHHTDKAKGKIFADVRNVPIISKGVNLTVSSFQKHYKPNGLTQGYCGVIATRKHHSIEQV